MTNLKKPPVPDQRNKVARSNTKKGFPSNPSVEAPLPERYSIAEISRFKKKILDSLDSGEAMNLTHACNILGISPTRAYYWRKTDEIWREHLKEAEQRLADVLERDLLTVEIGGKQVNMAFVTARIFLLKGIRPDKYRDNFKINVDDSKTKEILTELRSLAVKDRPALPESTEKAVSEPTETEINDA